MSLEQARIKLREMKAIRERGICPKADLERQEQERRKLVKAERVNSITLKDVIDHYLENYIQDRFTSSALFSLIVGHYNLRSFTSILCCLKSLLIVVKTKCIINKVGER